MNGERLVGFSSPKKNGRAVGGAKKVGVSIIPISELAQCAVPCAYPHPRSRLGFGPVSTLAYLEGFVKGNRALPDDYREVMKCEGRSLDLYNGRSPTNAMGAYGQAVVVTRFMRRSADIDISLTEPRSPHAVFGGLKTQLKDGHTTTYHQPYGGCAQWPINAGATFKPEVRWQGILMFPLFEKAVKARLRKL
jgi:hypothetical protein